MNLRRIGLAILLGGALSALSAAPVWAQGPDGEREKLRNELLKELDQRLDDARREMDARLNQLRKDFRRAVDRVLGTSGGNTAPAPAPTTGKPWVGARLAPIDEATRTLLDLPEGQGLQVVEVMDGGPAAKAGLKPYDFVLKVNGTPVGRTADFRAVLKGKKVGDTLKLEILHEGAKKTVALTLAAKPGASAAPANPGNMDEFLRRQFDRGRGNDQTPPPANPFGGQNPFGGEGMPDFLKRLQDPDFQKQMQERMQEFLKRMQEQNPGGGDQQNPFGNLPELFRRFQNPGGPGAPGPEAQPRNLPDSKKPWFGIMGDDPTDEMRTAGKLGVVVTEVMDNSSAAAAGVKVNDRIVKLDDKTVRTKADLREALGAKRAGQKATITVVRNGAEVTLEVTLKARSDR